MPDGDGLVLGAVNTSTAQTHLTRDGATLNGALSVANQNGGAIIGASANDWPGVHGASDRGPGTSGASNTADGVAGRSVSGAGVHGLSTESVGVLGITQGVGNPTEPRAGVRGVHVGDGFGVWGESDMVGVYGIGSHAGLYAQGTGGISSAAVEGWASDIGSGVWGIATGGIGVGGSSVASPGVYGGSTTGDGVLGWSRDGNGVTGSSDFGWAGYFDGRVHIEGDLVVTGTMSAAAQRTDGSHGRTYALQSPHGWLEDFGRAELVDGRATVPLADGFADLADLADTDEYHVFVTPEGECAGLYITRRGQRDFEVREAAAGRSSVPFSYRVVARPAGLDAATRLTSVAAPQPGPVGRRPEPRSPLRRPGAEE